MFVVHALVLTFMTTPLTILLYPSSVRVHLDKAAGAEDGAGRRIHSDNDDHIKTRFSVVLDKIEQLPAIMTITQLLQGAPGAPSSSLASARTSEDLKVADAHGFPAVPHSPTTSERPISVDALRLVELDQRTSAVLKSQTTDTLLLNDPVVSVFRTFGHLNRLSVSAALSVVSQDDYSASVAIHARDVGSDMVIVPWHGSFAQPQDGLEHNQTSVIHSNFVRKVFAESPADVALFLDGGLSSHMAATRQHVVLPFFGGPDDRRALSLVVQLCMNPDVTATVIRMRTGGAEAPPAGAQDAHVHNVSRGASRGGKAR
jgi:hypothetical protein